MPQVKQKPLLNEVQQPPQETALAVSRTFETIAEVISAYPEERFNLVLPLRAPKSTERYELWAVAVIIRPDDCIKLPGGKLMPLKHKLLELSREAGVIVESLDQVLPSTWKPAVELGRALGQLPQSPHLSRDWILHALKDLLHYRRNDVAVRASVLLEVAPGEFVRAMGTAEWIEEDEHAIVERSVRRQAPEKGWDEEAIQKEIEDRLLDIRRFRVRIAETKALLRAIRAVLSLKTAYSPEEIAKPFIVVSWRRILSDEEIEERWREVFGDFTHEQRPAKVRVVEVTEADADNGEISEVTSPDEIPSELDMM